MQNRIRLLPLVISSTDSSQMVTGTNKMARKPGQGRCPKSVLTALTCDYLTALVILAAAPAVNAAVLPSPTSPAKSELIHMQKLIF